MAKGDVRTVATSTKGGDLGTTAVIGNMVISFDGLDRDQIIDIAVGALVIRRQTVYRKMTPAAVKELLLKGDHFHAIESGKKPMTSAERLANAKATYAAMSAEDRKAFMAEVAAAEVAS